MTAATMPRERPILFSAPMVRAILAGTKTQTRRIVKPYPPSEWNPLPYLVEIHGRDRAGELNPDRVLGMGFCSDDGEWGLVCRYGVVGDRLWVRETWGKWDTAVLVGRDPAIVYRADFAPDLADDVTWRPSIHMPRLACRLVVEITDVRVQRLHDISEDDARAEGIEHRATCYFPPTRDGSGERAPDPQSTARSAFALLWDDVNGGGAWGANAWVWALTFKQVTP